MFSTYSFQKPCFCPSSMSVRSEDRGEVPLSNSNSHQAVFRHYIYGGGCAYCYASVLFLCSLLRNSRVSSRHFSIPRVVTPHIWKHEEREYFYSRAINTSRSVQWRNWSCFQDTVHPLRAQPLLILLGGSLAAHMAPNLAHSGTHITLNQRICGHSQGSTTETNEDKSPYRFMTISL